ncbi:DUF1775 domain-containing protein [Actinoplanes sp. TBRC 11911]|uniref:DUF1775 domain-containing protein n=1 Tax=Actinoplanes sp. TBRC 11911 TaxID=2729386 RepID=UPI00145CB6FB|nr:DUF1775 domain-containing protein [Actinoplanes sp. TBRC 11911]NMO53606.1 DUF1775 domain-containing protein [Actinoplanes sp. TBRC 11911]
MRYFQLARRAGVPAAAVLFGVLAAGPALADVSVNPPSAPQGSAQNFVFHVTNDGTAAMTQVKLSLPADTSVAELYPLSVDGWAPKIDTKTLATPIPQIHGGVPTTQVAEAITWIAMPGKALAPGKSADLTVALGPLPALSQMKWNFAATYGDGKPGPALTAPVVKLTPADPNDPSVAEHAAHEGGTAATGTTTTGSDDAENQFFAKTASDAQRGTSIWAILGWVVAGLAVLAGAVMMLRGRHRAEQDEEPSSSSSSSSDDDETESSSDGDEKEPVTAGTSKWSFKG